MGLFDWLNPRPKPKPSAGPVRRRASLVELGMSAALLPDERGDDACVGCGLCATICPERALSVEGSAVGVSARTGRPRGWAIRFRLDPGLCVACELCTQICPTDAIRLYRAPEQASAEPLELERLRAQGVERGGPRRRSPLGEVPGDTPRAPLVRPATGAPTPAVDLARPMRRPEPHPAEEPTGEPTRMETWAHPIDAPTDPDSQDVEAVGDYGRWPELEALRPEPGPLRPASADVATLPNVPQGPERNHETTDALPPVRPRR